MLVCLGYAKYAEAFFNPLAYQGFFVIAGPAPICYNKIDYMFAYRRKLKVIKILPEINAVYARSEEKQAELMHSLSHEIFEIASGWYNGHYQKNEAGKWCRDSYPIPVISIKSLCDIEIQFDHIAVSTKLKRDAALAYSYDKIMAFEFEAFGVEDYLADFFHRGQTLQDLKTNIRHCKEAEIGFSFVFPFASSGKVIFEFAKLLKQEGFYY